MNPDFTIFAQNGDFDTLNEAILGLYRRVFGKTWVLSICWAAMTDRTNFLIARYFELVLASLLTGFWGLGASSRCCFELRIILMGTLFWGFLNWESFLFFSLRGSEPFKTAVSGGF